MPLSQVDQRELLIALYRLGDAAPFVAFLELFRRRMAAKEAFLCRRDHRDGAIHIDAHAASGMLVEALDPALLRALRPGRVYPLEELGDVIAGRVIRGSGAGGDWWLGARGGTFVAADSALLSDLAPHVAIALDNRQLVTNAQVAARAAATALERAGVGWSMLDERGEPALGPAPALSAARRQALVTALADGAPIASDERILALPADDHAALLLFRTTQHPLARARAFAAAFNLSQAEARVAIAVAEGASIAQAATQLGLTEQTVRHYTKRLYAATGTQNQAGLVRLVWTSVAALA